jgi:hypothetical protein
MAALPATGAAAGTGEPLPREPWPSGELRTGITAAFVIHRPPGSSHAAVRALAGKGGDRYLPGFKRFERADVQRAPAGALFVILEGPNDPVESRYLASFGRGLEPARAGWLGRRHPSTLLLVRAPAAQADAALRGLVTLVAELALKLDGAVDDPEARVIQSPRTFDEDVRRYGFEGGVPVVTHHITIHAYERDDGLLRSVSLGMAKLGLPDLVVNGHARRNGNQIGNLMNTVAQWMVEDGQVPRAGWIELDFQAIRARSVREPLLASLTKHAKGRASLSIAVAAREEGDADNALLELTFAGKPGTAGERQEAIVGELFGSEDAIVHVEHARPLLAESAAARDRLLALKPRWLRERKPGEVLLVKGPFKTRSGGNEWMWVEVTRWEGTRITGLLANDPFEVPGLRAGATVHVEESKVFDYLLRRADGSEEGNTTSKLLERR